MSDDQVQVTFEARTGDFNAAMQQLAANVSQAMDKVAQALNQTSDVSKKVSDSMQQQVQTITATQRSEQEKQARDADAMQNIALKGEQRHEEAVYNLRMEDLHTRQQLGQISAREELALQRQLLDTKFAAEKADLTARLDLKNLEPKEVARINVELKALEDHRRLEMKKNDDQMAIETQNRWKSILDPIASSFSQAVNGMITKTTSFGDAMRSVFQSLLSQVIGVIAKKLEAWILGETAQTAATAAGSAARQGIEETAAKESLLTQAMTSLKKIFNAAQETFAGVFANLSPYLGPLAVVPAGAAAALVLATGGALNFAEKGWDVPADSLAMLHKREMVLPAELADRVRNMTGAGANSAGGALHVHIHAMDSQDVERALKNNQSALFRILQAGRRNFAL